MGAHVTPETHKKAPVLALDLCMALLRLGVPLPHKTAGPFPFGDASSEAEAGDLSGGVGVDRAGPSAGRFLRQSTHRSPEVFFLRQFLFFFSSHLFWGGSLLGVPSGSP